MKRHFCDCCGDQYDPNDRAFRPFRPPDKKEPDRTGYSDGSEYPEKVTISRNKDIVKENLQQCQTLEFKVRILVWVHTLGRVATDELDICPNCLWKAVNQCDPRDRNQPSKEPPTVDEMKKMMRFPE